MKKLIFILFCLLPTFCFADFQLVDDTGNTIFQSTYSGNTAGFKIRYATTLPTYCEVGQLFMDSDATTGRRIYACESTDTRVLQGDGNSGGSPTWGTIVGTLSSQTDLQGALDNKSATTHNHSGVYEPAGITASDISDKHAGTDITADLEEETHATEHQDNGADEIAVTAGMMNTGTGASATTYWRGDNTWVTPSGGGLGYAFRLVTANQATTTDSQTLYWGGMAVAPNTTAARWRSYIPKAGTIKAAYIYSYSGTAGSNETWTMAIRLNNTSNTTIQALASSSADRVWSNTSLSISVVAGDYIEIIETQPAWVTNPATVTRNGVVYIE
jgi:hypothetical protein